MSLQSIPIFGYDQQGGLQTNKKPVFIPDKAFQRLENAYAWRDRVLSRDGLKFMGRLQRILTNQFEATTVAGPPSSLTFNAFSSVGAAGLITNATQAVNCQITSLNHNLVTGDTITISGVVGMTQLNGNTYDVTFVDPNNFTIGINSTGFGAYVSGGQWINTSEPNPQISPGTLIITVGAPDTATFTDQGNGTFAVTGAGVAAGSYVNYSTGIVVLQFSALIGGATVTANYNYFPTLPVMGIPRREIEAINDEQTIWFDTKYAYIWNGTSFQEFIPGTKWKGSNSDFFWATNYRGVKAEDRLFFATNFVNNSFNPIRYTDGNTWTTFNPILSGNATDNVSIGSIEGSGTTFNGVLPNFPVIPSSLTITVAGIVFNDPTGSGILTGNPNTNTGTVNYNTGAVTLNFSPTINFTGAITNITQAANGVVTCSAAHNLTTGAQLTITGVASGSMTQINNGTFTITVTGANTFQLNQSTLAYSPYVVGSGGTWTLTTQATTVMASYQVGNNFLFQARILIPYFGRLLALNVWEGNSVGTAVNIFNRCRFSQLGNPVQSDAWRSDVFGKGGFIDAPTNELIVGATFLNNTLIVFFEQTTWQLRYVGEYGLPFIWERIASDLGSESTFSTVLFNQHILAIGDKAIISADSTAVTRIDLDIPDQIFDFQNGNFGVKRVQGIRDYQKELVYWCYADASTQAAPGVGLTFPNKVLVYNYRNNTWAIFRDSITAFGTVQITSNITWDSEVVYWDSEIVTWDDFDTQSRFPLIVGGNQMGFVNFYQIQGPEGTPIVNANEQPSLAITNVTTTNNVLNLTIPNHNLQEDEIIYLTNLTFINSSTFTPVSTDLNNKLYSVSVIDANTVSLFRWDFVGNQYYSNFSYMPDLSTSTYIGGGQATLFPKPLIQTKDFNPFQTKGLQAKLSYIDMLMDVNPTPTGTSISGATQSNPCQITSTAHGLSSGQQIYIFGVGGMTQLNTSQVYTVTVVDANNFTINVNSTNFSAYTGGGAWVPVVADVSIELFRNSSLASIGNLAVGNKLLSTSTNDPFFAPFYPVASEYSWCRFYATCAGQYFNVLLFYDDNLMNTLSTHQKKLTLNAMNIWVRPGGKILF